MKNKGSPPITFKLNSFRLAFVYCLVFTSLASSSWVKDLFDPSISMWDPLQSDAILEQTNLGFSKFAGYAVAFGDFDSDKQYGKTDKTIQNQSNSKKQCRYICSERKCK